MTKNKTNTFKEVVNRLSRSTLANVVAAIIVITGTIYFIYKGDSESLKWIAAFGLGWLFKGKPAKET